MAIPKTATPMGFVPTSDLERAREFYAGVLGLEVVAEDPFAVTCEARGLVLRLTRVEGHRPAAHTILGWQVEDLARAMAELREAGVAFRVFPGMGQDAEGVWAAPSGVRVVWFKDPDGNLLSLACG